MSDSDVYSAVTAAPDADPPPTPMPNSSPPPPMEEPPANPIPNAVPSPSPITFSLWPPSQRTRDAVIASLIGTLSTPSALSRRYGTLPLEEASEAACAIEVEAFNATGGASTASPDDEGLQILQIYSKEISKRMLDFVKARSAATDGGDAAVEAPVAKKAGADSEA